jgi:hypothetical protein
MCFLFLLIVVLFGFLNIKSVKIYAIPYIFSTTLLLNLKSIGQQIKILERLKDISNDRTNERTPGISISPAPRKNICHTIYFFNNTIIVQVGYIMK